MTTDLEESRREVVPDVETAVVLGSASPPQGGLRDASWRSRGVLARSRGWQQRRRRSRRAYPTPRRRQGRCPPEFFRRDLRHGTPRRRLGRNHARRSWVAPGVARGGTQRHSRLDGLGPPVVFAICCSGSSSGPLSPSVTARFVSRRSLRKATRSRGKAGWRGRAEALGESCEAVPTRCDARLVARPRVQVVRSRRPYLATLNDEVHAKLVAAGFSEIVYEEHDAGSQPACGVVRYDGPPLSSQSVSRFPLRSMNYTSVSRRSTCAGEHWLGLSAMISS